MVRDGQAAPSCHLAADDGFQGDIITQTVLIPQTAKHTYFCVLQWNAGVDGGGYCGLQDHPDGKLCIFSLWNPKSTTNRINGLRDERSATTFAEFGGEGEGLKAMNANYVWKLDTWYTFVLRRWCGTYRDGNGRNIPSTMFGLWIHEAKDNNWTHVCSYNYPVADVYFISETNAFLEDWIESGRYARSMFLTGGAKRCVEGKKKKWSSFAAMRFSANQEPRSANFMKRYDAFCNNANAAAGAPFTQFYMACGGKTCPRIPKPTALLRPSSASAASPGSHALTPAAMYPLQFSITQCKASKVVWMVTAPSAPLFTALVKVNGVIVATKHAHDLLSSFKDKYDILLLMFFGFSL
eukprot:GEMP01046624.1.p1 GENE.GEMP01046624.1~~GEMP01046624.1.p1  ORF type:complete len:352 (+),score=86.21 GEMP01046624.1:145-1200(+)